MKSCYGPNVHVFQFICRNLTSKLMVSGGGAFGRWLGHEGGAPTMGLMSLLKRPQRAPSPLSPGEDTAEYMVYEPWRGSSPDTGLLKPWSWTSSLQNCEKWMSVYVSHPDYGIFVTAAGADWDISPNLLPFLLPSSGASFSRSSWRPVRSDAGQPLGHRAGWGKVEAASGGSKEKPPITACC